MGMAVGRQLQGSTATAQPAVHKRKKEEEGERGMGVRAGEGRARQGRSKRATQLLLPGVHSDCSCEDQRSIFHILFLPVLLNTWVHTSPRAARSGVLGGRLFPG